MQFKNGLRVRFLSKVPKNAKFFRCFLDCKEPNEFQFDSGKFMEWLYGFADIKRSTLLLV